MSRKTDFTELYDTFGALLEGATGREWWRKAGIQSQPDTPYATLYFTQTVGLEQQVVSSIELDPVGDLGEVFEQNPWGAGKLDCLVEFYRGTDTDTALMAATRFKNSLRLEERFWDVWLISGLIGAVTLVDVSAIFRADVEERAEVRFSLYVNLGDPMPLNATKIYDIQHQTVNVEHINSKEEATDIPLTIDAPIEEE